MSRKTKKGVSKDETTINYPSIQFLFALKLNKNLLRTSGEKNFNNFRISSKRKYVVIIIFLLIVFILSGCKITDMVQPNPKTYIVIGASAAGIGAVQTLATYVSERDTIILISKDGDAPYDRTRLKKYIATSHIPVIQSPDNCTNVLFVHDEVISIQRQDKTITCADGGVIAYDYLFLGIGAEPRIPDIPHVHTCKGVFRYYTLGDVHAMTEYMATHPIESVVVIGGGLASLEISHALMMHGYHVHQCVRAERILKDKTDEGGAQAIQNLFSIHGMQWHVNAMVKQILCTHDVITGVRLQDDTILAADMIVYAIGGSLDMQLIGDLATDQGSLVVDAHMQTSDPYIYAGGDAICVWDYVNTCFVRNSKWHDAFKQGACAAHNMCGHTKLYYGTACVHKACYFDAYIALSGPMAQPPINYTYTVNTHDGYRAVLMQDNQLKGFCLVQVPHKEIKQYSLILKNDN